MLYAPKLGRKKQKAQTPSSGDCVYGLAQFPSQEMGAEVENQLAAPTEARTPNRHRAKSKSLIQECGWKGGDQRRPWLGKQLDQQKTKRIDLIPTGILMEGHFAH